MKKGAEVGKIILIRGQMIHRLDPLKRSLPIGLVADIAADPFTILGEIVGDTILMHRRANVIEHPDFVAKGQERIYRVRPDKPQPAGNQDMHGGGLLAFQGAKVKNDSATKTSGCGANPRRK